MGELVKKRIVFTGGGSAGHVTVNLALIPKFLELGWDVSYIGSESGIERELISTLNSVKYYPISTGKLRRYFDVKNFKDPLKVLKGIFQAKSILSNIKPDVIFSKGGFVSVPVVIGAKLNKLPVIIHESDLTPGLANKISIPFATKVCVTFPETISHIPEHKAVSIGPIVREEILKGKKSEGLKLCDFISVKPVLLIMGGSLGAKRINEAVHNNLDMLVKQFQIVHICGKGNLNPSLARKGYKQFEYVGSELPHLMQMTDIVISRAGSNSIFEFLALKKPMLLIPLSKAQSRGDQILNAESFYKSGFCEVLQEEELTDERFLIEVNDLFLNKDKYIENMMTVTESDSLNNVLSLIQRVGKKEE